MKITLREEEIESLKQRHRAQTDGRKRDRIKAILMLNRGYTAREVSEVLMLNENTITGWKQRYLNRKDGVDWLIHHCVGYEGKLTPCEEKKVVAYVEENLIADSKQVIQFIQDTFAKSYSKSGVIALLNRLNFTYKKTTLIPAKLDLEKQKAFKIAYDEFKDHLKDDEALLFLDGVHPQHNTKCSHAWIKVGKEKQIKSNSGRKRLNISGAYSPHTQDILFSEDKTINQETVIKFFKQIESFYPNKASIFAIADQAPYYKNAAVKTYLETSRIELIQLPTYSPNLNLIERLWKLMRRDVINNHYYEKFKDFKAAIVAFFQNNSTQFKETLRRFIGLELHLINSS